MLRVEQERIFTRSWQYATRADLVAEPGSMTPAWAGSLPVLVVRDGGGDVRAFVNVCRHRGAIIASVTSAFINLPIVVRVSDDPALAHRVGRTIVFVMLLGIAGSLLQLATNP